MIHALLERVRNSNNLFIQTHDFPDHDAVASAFGLQCLLRHFGIESTLVYEGVIERDSLRKMIRDLQITIKHLSDIEMREGHPIVIVDGCKGNKNVTDMIGDEICNIDHHLVTSPADVPLSDIRSHLGACSTLILEYYHTLDVKPEQAVATALMVGLNMDTALLTRNVSEQDVEAYAYLYGIADISLVNSILRNYVQVKDMAFFRGALDSIEVFGKAGYCYFPQGCNQNLLGILGDFFMSFQEIDIVVLLANNSDRINFSVRSEAEPVNAAHLVRNLLEDIGFGGGHADMAGGMIKDTALFQEELIKGRLRAYLKK